MTEPEVKVHVPNAGLRLATSPGSGMNNGIRCIAVKLKPDEWIIQECWLSVELGIDFDDFGVNKSHAYGFNACIPVASCNHQQQI